MLALGNKLTKAKYPWPNIDALVEDPTVSDELIKELATETKEEIKKHNAFIVKLKKTYKKLANRAESHTTLNNLGKKSRPGKHPKKPKTVQETRRRRDLKDYPRLNDLYNKYLSDYEDKTVNVFGFDINVPVDGIKYRIDKKGGSVFIPITHLTIYQTLPVYLREYLSSTANSIMENVPGRIRFFLDVILMFTKDKIMYERPAFDNVKGMNLSSSNYVAEFCELAINNIMH
jgi:hypothetical protein